MVSALVFVVQPPSPEALKAAIESLSRIRTLELPPDSTGGRTLFHRGQGADLATRVDADGKVVRHELFCSGLYLSWAKTGIKTGAAPDGTVEAMISRGDGPAQNVTLDADVGVQAQRTADVGTALTGVVTSDPVLEHLKRVVADGVMANLSVTRSQHAVDIEAMRLEAEESQRRELQRRKKAQVAVLVVFGVMILLAFGSIAAWIITR
ncbi:MAG: hypothetical protein JNK82_03005 [Myxococcaceae bacterium]|nr:hypothetical protein [Myxococcaceae bacterium]